MLTLSVFIRVHPWLLVVCLAACASRAPHARTTFLNSVDLIEMTDRMAQSFAADEVISARRPNDQRWVISIDRVVNHTNQIIPDGEKWLYIARLRSLLAQSDLSRQRSIIWVMPPEKWASVAAELGAAHEPPGLRMKPTHVLTAEFHALTLTSGGGRSDTYHCAYFLADLERGAEVWRGAWEVKRAISGRTYD